MIALASTGKGTLVTEEENVIPGWGAVMGCCKDV